MAATDILFYGFALFAVISAFLVVFMSNPIYSALFLALSMSILGALFFMLQAYFVAVAQITVYAGAVMVLFVMVIMLFDLKRESEDVFKISPLNVAKIGAAAVLCGFLVGTGWLTVSLEKMTVAPGTTVQDLAKQPGATLPPASVAAQTQVGAVPGVTQAPTEAVPGTAARPPPSEGLAANSATSNPDEDLTAAEAAKLVDAPSASGVNSPSAAVISQQTPGDDESFGSTAVLSRTLFSKYVFAFEAVSLLLLVAIVGAVALAKSKGGTHHVT